jgi:hypothetical protein
MKERALIAFQAAAISGEAEVTVSLSHAEDRVYAGHIINGQILYPTFAYLVRCFLACSIHTLNLHLVALNDPVLQSSF